MRQKNREEQVMEMTSKAWTRTTLLMKTRMRGITNLLGVVLRSSSTSSLLTNSFESKWQIINRSAQKPSSFRLRPTSLFPSCCATRHSLFCPYQKMSRILPWQCLLNDSWRTDRCVRIANPKSIECWRRVPSIWSSTFESAMPFNWRAKRRNRSGSPNRMRFAIV